MCSIFMTKEDRDFGIEFIKNNKKDKLMIENVEGFEDFALV
mgnify:CR=1 FL=1